MSMRFGDLTYTEVRELATSGALAVVGHTLWELAVQHLVEVYRKVAATGLS